MLLACLVLSACGDGGTPEETACAAFDGASSEACELSYDLCSVVTPAAVVEEYGGDPAIPGEVARAYSEQSYVPAARQAAAAGCEDGFASQDEDG